MLKKKINGVVVSFENSWEISLYHERHRDLHEFDIGCSCEMEHYLPTKEYCYCYQQLVVEYEFNQDKKTVTFDKIYINKEVQIGDEFKLVYDKKRGTVDSAL